MIRSELIELLRGSASTRDTIGVEVELLAVEPASGRAAPGSRIARARARCRGDVTFEAPGQIELRTAPVGSVRELAPVVGAAFDDALGGLAAEELCGVALGFQPFAELRSATFTNAPTAMSSDEMVLSHAAAVHVSVSYRDERDAGRKLAAAHAIAPRLVALFGGSPIARGQVAGVSFRSSVWASAFAANRPGPGLLDGADGLFERYVDWALARPGPAAATQVRDQLRFPTAVARLKEVVEVRCLDSVPPRAVVAAAALVRGLLVDQDNLAALSSEMRTASDQANAWATAARLGLADATLAGEVDALVARAAAGLARLGDNPEALAWAREAITARRNWGQRVAQLWDESGRAPRGFLRAIANEMARLAVTAA